MEPEELEHVVARKSAWIYVPISASAALLFFFAAQSGGYSSTSAYAGAAWVALLSLIVAMPVVTSRVKKNMR